jgi:energy-coupling factor transporter transmembrane protein EcfT
MVSAMGVAFYVVFAGIILAMAVLLFGAWRGKGPLYWLLAAVPALLPLFFIIDYSAWLWWYGHNLSDMGAFTVKEFMPTVFGDGKVAQFSTHSYPHIGFGLMLLLSVTVALMVILRRKQLNRAAS